MLVSLACVKSVTDIFHWKYNENIKCFQVVKESRKQEIIATSIRHSIVTKFTSFVAVELREKDEEVVLFN